MELTVLMTSVFNHSIFNGLPGLTAVLLHERLTVLTTMWPHIIVTCPCSPRTLCHVKSIRYHHHHHHIERALV